MNAVAEQTSSVSMNTDSICTRPCLAGCETSGVRRRAHAGLIGVQAALDAPHDARTGEAAERRLEIERITEDIGDDAREDPDVHENDDERHEDIQHAHDRHEHARDIGQALAAAEHTHGEQHREDSADDVRRAALGVEAKAGESVLQVVGGKHVVAHDIRQDEHDGENDAEPALVQCLLHVIRRAADAAALAVLFLIDLRERGLDKGARPAEQRHYPHPEHGAEAAEADGRGHADDVAGTDTGRRGHHERAERGNAALLLRLFRDDVDGLAKQAELDQTGADREIQARDDQKQRHDVRLIQKAADCIDHTVNFVNHDLSPLQFFIFPAAKRPRKG